MFCDDMPTGAVDVRVAGTACAEPTMTFHSRAALDMVNGMFKDTTTQPLRGHRSATGRVSRGRIMGTDSCSRTCLYQVLSILIFAVFSYLYNVMHFPAALSCCNVIAIVSADIKCYSNLYIWVRMGLLAQLLPVRPHNSRYNASRIPRAV
jgi:hypothetical protein